MDDKNKIWRVKMERYMRVHIDEDRAGALDPKQ